MKAWAAHWWPIVLLMAVVWGGVAYIDNLQGKLAAARLDRDQVALQAVGASVAFGATEAQLRARASELERGSALLALELERIRGALPGAKPSWVGSGSTGPRPVQGTPAADTGDNPRPGGIEPGGQCPAALPPCLLTAADQVELKVALVALEGDSGAVGVAGVASAWRAGPDGPVLLAEGPLKLEVQTKKHPGVDLPGWGAGVLTTAQRAGWAVGPVVSPPPVRVWGLEGSLLAGVALGPGGEWTVAGMGLLRW